MKSSHAARTDKAGRTLYVGALLRLCWQRVRAHRRRHPRGRLHRSPGSAHAGVFLSAAGRNTPFGLGAAAQHLAPGRQPRDRV